MFSSFDANQIAGALCSDDVRLFNSQITQIERREERQSADGVLCDDAANQAVREAEFFAMQIAMTRKKVNVFRHLLHKHGSNFRANSGQWIDGVEMPFVIWAFRHKYDVPDDLFNEVLQCADVNDQDYSGTTLLHVAVIREDKEYLRRLLELGADPSVPNRGGLSAQNMAHHRLEQLSQNAPKSPRVKFWREVCDLLDQRLAPKPR